MSTAEVDVSLITSTKETISELGLANSAAKIAPAGTLLMALYGQGKTRGKTSMLGIDAAMNQACAAIQPNEGVDPLFLLAYLRHHYEMIRALSNAGGQENLTSEIVKNIPILITDRDMQARIAQASGDASGLVDGLERLIAKKQAIKEGLMQQLLTGRARLPGFRGPWRSVRLGDVLTVRHGRSQRGVESSQGRYPILATGGRIGWADRPLYASPSVLIGRKGTIDKPRYQETPFWTVDTLFYTEISAAVDPQYLYHVFLTVDWKAMNEASGVPSLTSNRIEGVEFQMPTLEEQRAIRSILVDADLEIHAHQSRLGKARAVKQGMMQELLTGRTRLPV